MVFLIRDIFGNQSWKVSLNGYPPTVAYTVLISTDMRKQVVRVGGGGDNDI